MTQNKQGDWKTLGLELLGHGLHVLNFRHCLAPCLRIHSCSGIGYHITNNGHNCSLFAGIPRILSKIPDEKITGNVWVKPVTCKDNFCQNGGTCQNIKLSTSSYIAYKCICPWFVTGHECETLLPAHQFCNNSIYWVNKDTPRYDDAITSCQKKNARVALVTKNEIHECLKSLLTETITDLESYFGFYISNSSPSKWLSELIPWAASQPSDNDECIVMWVSNNLDWDDTSCTYTELKKGVICEINV